VLCGKCAAIIPGLNLCGNCAGFVTLYKPCRAVGKARQCAVVRDCAAIAENIASGVAFEVVASRGG
jgi:hypothetical protein